MKRNICVVTGTRAEYGLLRPLLLRLKKERSFRLQLLVTGMHLSERFGLTYKEIVSDGFKIDKMVRLPLENDTPEGIADALGVAISGCTKAFKRLNPYCVVVLGDRFEMFAAAVAAFISRIPLVHLFGGELSEGAIDDAFRHAITKMAIIHCTSTREYRQRVIQLGEDPRRVFNVGALGLDTIADTRLVAKESLEKMLHFRFGKKTALVTFHPVTLEENTAASQFEEILKALDRCKDFKVIFTKPNADTGNGSIASGIDRYVRKNPQKAVSFISLGSLKYLSVIKHVDVVLGNSSSGLIEAPSLGKPSINIGDRQRGRLRPRSVIQCAPRASSICRALKKATSIRFMNTCRRIKNPYGNGNSARTIMGVLKRKAPEMKNLKKSFYEIRRPSRV